MQKHIAHNEGYSYIPLDDSTNYYYTSDFDLSVTLLCKGYDLIMISNESSGKLVFVFKNFPEIPSLIDGYWSNKITVNPLEFANARKNLKSRIFGIRKSTNQ